MTSVASIKERVNIGCTVSTEGIFGIDFINRGQGGSILNVFLTRNWVPYLASNLGHIIV